MRIAVVWNALAGHASGADPQIVQQQLADQLSADVHVLDVCDERSPSQCARAALERGCDVVVAAGGDGTVSGVAAELVGRHERLAVLPIGTSNSFACALGIPTELDAALAVLTSAEERLLDVAIVRGENRAPCTMVLHSMVGFHADVITDTACDAKRRWGVLAYAASAVRHLTRVDTFAVELTTDNHVVRCRGTAIAAANLAPIKTVLAHGPSHLLCDDGMVDITIVAADTPAEAIATGVHLWRTAREGEPARRDSVGSLSSTRVTISTEPPQHVLVDGEPYGTTPIAIETLPRALRVIAPAAPHAEGPPVEASLVGLPELEILPAAKPA